MGYIAAKKKENSIGLIALSTAVFEGIAKHALDEDRDVKPYRPSSRNSFKCKVVEDHIHIDAGVLIRNGAIVSDTAARAQALIKNSVAQMTGYHNTSVNVVVKGFFK
ncbi:MAG: Asp23/Gls24 family envelope stress response protein [Erysipelotrichaceae bacterium]|nr:Asp23/Gls24 family envelope stress response protein [Erysipelotrichaceae bacterium]